MMGYLAGALFGALFIPLSYFGPALLHKKIVFRNKWLETLVLLVTFIAIIAFGSLLAAEIVDLASSSIEHRKELAKNSAMGFYFGLLAMWIVVIVVNKVRRWRN